MSQTTAETFFKNLMTARGYVVPEDFFESYDHSDPCKVEEPQSFAGKVRKMTPDFLEEEGHDISRCGKNPRFRFGFHEEFRSWFLNFHSRAPQDPTGDGIEITIPGDWNTSAEEYARRLAEAIAEELILRDELCSDLDCSGRSKEDKIEYIERRKERIESD